MPFILNDEDYKREYGTELKLAVLQARAKANCLLKGYDICLSAHVQPPLRSLSSIISSAGGNVSSFSINYLSGFGKDDFSRLFVRVLGNKLQFSFSL